ncbi:hypothetical protein NQ314_007348 [Rhamnusium bicolor]|uniref:PiggyBac transposable element-derived protein domain-containing protein n=1 Tax=Rhamnusium bicolor TaxID=1586634 RepID=A0AAV8YP24_9CUCU|nr:hypothetical protein NQ314_007348 [Rhamnusium bicolor]
MLEVDEIKKEIYCCGTVRSSRKNLPNNLKNDNKLTRGEWDWFTRREMLTCVKWKDKAVVTVLSTINAPTESVPVGKREKAGTIIQINCSQTVNDYRRCMGDVDRADMLKSYYAIDRKSRKWWHRLFWHFIDTALVNSFIIYKQATENGLKLKDFRLEVISGLVSINRLKRDLERSPFFENSCKVHVPINLRTDQAKYMPVHGTNKNCFLEFHKK